MNGNVKEADSAKIKKLKTKKNNIDMEIYRIKFDATLVKNAIEDACDNDVNDKEFKEDYSTNPNPFAFGFSQLHGMTRQSYRNIKCILPIVELFIIANNKKILPLQKESEEVGHQIYAQETYEIKEKQLTSILHKSEITTNALQIANLEKGIEAIKYPDQAEATREKKASAYKNNYAKIENLKNVGI